MPAGKHQTNEDSFSAELEHDYQTKACYKNWRLTHLLLCNSYTHPTNSNKLQSRVQPNLDTFQASQQKLGDRIMDKFRFKFMYPETSAAVLSPSLFSFYPTKPFQMPQAEFGTRP